MPRGSLLGLGGACEGVSGSWLYGGICVMSVLCLLPCTRAASAPLPETKLSGAITCSVSYMAWLLNTSICFYQEPNFWIHCHTLWERGFPKPSAS